MGTNLLGPYYEGAFRAAIASYFFNGKISERLIDLAKETISRFREYEIEHALIDPAQKEELKRQWKQWLEATTQGIKDEFRAQGKLE